MGQEAMGMDRLVGQYKELKSIVKSRADEFERFTGFLEQYTSWLSAPASTRFHLAEPGGLLAHSVNVVETMLKLRKTLAPEVSKESCVLVGLFHDLGKIGMPGKPYYLPNPSQWHVRNRGIHYIVSKDLIHLDVPSRSLFLLAQHIPLSEEEVQAIRYHDGQHIPENHSVAHRETKLTLLLQYADNWSGEVLEGESQIGEASVANQYRTD